MILVTIITPYFGYFSSALKIVFEVKNIGLHCYIIVYDIQ